MERDIFSPNMEVRILQIFLIGLTFLFGGFYEFSGCIAGIFLAVYLLWFVYRRGKIYVSLSFCFAAMVILCVGYGAAVFYGVDKGMAFLGFLKTLSGILFAIVVMQLAPEEKMYLFKTVPLAGCMIIIVSLFALITGAGREMLFLSGRLGGTFQYSNTMALYFLAGMAVLFTVGGSKKTYAVMTGGLYVGILMTGSRTVFIMAVLYLVICMVVNRRYCTIHALILGISMVSGIFYAAVTMDFQNIGRFLTISLESSTLLGRFLYWQDGIHIVKDHVFGIGAGGYEYLQGQYQTGVYAVKYIHNEYLQYMIDAGVLPALLFIAAILKSFLSNRTMTLQKVILLMIGAHSFVDFDLQFLAMLFLVILCFDMKGKYEYSRTWKQARVPCILCLVTVSAVWGCFAVPLLTFYQGKVQEAYEMFPGYTEAGVWLLENCDSLEEAKEVSDTVLKGNQSVSAAYGARALVAFNKDNYSEVIENQREAVRLKPYELRGYVTHLQMMAQGLKYYKEQDGKEGYEMCRDEMLSVPGMLDEVKERTSSLGYKIQDKPELTLPEEIREYLERL